ncbi:MAG: EAL domain-containing protein [Cyanobacteriota bacterium]|nr:EAL domain-containing protein [Cyanobacteriota bacterium]
MAESCPLEKSSRIFSILIVDDEPDNFDVIEALLSVEMSTSKSSLLYKLHYASSGKNALSALNLYQPDLILMDVMMPDMNGIQACQLIKEMPEWEGVPIVMVTALSSKEDLANCLNAGADDFIAKPVNRLELTARIRSMLRIREQYLELSTFNRQLEYLVRARTEQLQIMIDQDSLTSLASRTQLLRRLETILVNEDYAFAILCLDCDEFKLINGSFGHAVGDQLLIEVAKRLQAHCRSSDLIARLGEDEFCFLVYPLEDVVALEALIHNIFQSFVDPFKVISFEVFMTACIGVALGSYPPQSPEQWLQDADTAMYQAKLNTKNSYQIFDRQMHVAILNRLTLESDLQRAVNNDEFVIYYQPIIHLKTQKLSGFEALVRWHHPTRRIVSPAEFIPCMETTGLIVPVGLLVMQRACQQLHSWHQEGWQDLTMSINLSVRQFSSHTLVADIDQILQTTAVNSSAIKIEITESSLMDNIELAIKVIRQLRERHIQISIDDFGTGYSSLGYLHQFPIDSLKIDQSFIRQFQNIGSSYPVVEIIVSLSKKLNVTVIAEGIETPDQLLWLQQIGCDFGQGYLFSKPLAATEIEALFLASS